MRSFKETVCTHSTRDCKSSSTDMRLERDISIAWFCFGKSCLSYAIFNFWILSPNNLFICTVTLVTSFQIPKRTQCKNSFGKQFQFMDFSISPFSEGIRPVTPSEAWYDNTVIHVYWLLRRFWSALLFQWTIRRGEVKGRRNSHPNISIRQED